MSEPAVMTSAQALIHARRDARALPAWPPAVPDAWAPHDLASAYALQRHVAHGTGAVRGWKVSALTALQQQALHVACPIAAPLLDPWVQFGDAARFRLARFIQPRLECEFAFELANDLPERSAPYARAEVLAAIAHLRIGVEITDSRLPPRAGVWAELADAFNNGAYVVGAACAAWQALDFAHHAIVLTAETSGIRHELARGDGRPVLDGDPLGAVLALANAQPAGYGGLRSGQVVTTGTCTGAVAIPGPGRVLADFGALGRIELSFE